MRTPVRPALLFALLSFAAAGAASPQQRPTAEQAPAAAPQPAPAAASQPTSPRRITLDVVVTPKSGPPVAGLTQSDFTLLSNRLPQPIASFTAVDGAQAPAEVVLLIDAVNTDARTISIERQQISKFLRANGGHLAHPFTLALFTDTGTQIQQGLSSDGNALADVLDHTQIPLRAIRADAGAAGAEDRLNLSLSALQLLVAKIAPLPGRKIILWISPGWPYLSGPNMLLTQKQQQALFASVVGVSTLLRQDRITLYSVDPLGAAQGVGGQFYYENFLKGITKPGQVEVADLSLQVLATQSGGLVLSGNNDVAGLLDRCLADASAWYQITFDAAPADRSDDYHELQVTVDKPGLTARTRTGYYAQP